MSYPAVQLCLALLFVQILHAVQLVQILQLDLALLSSQKVQQGLLVRMILLVLFLLSSQKVQRVLVHHGHLSDLVDRLVLRDLLAHLGQIVQVVQTDLI